MATYTGIPMPLAVSVKTGSYTIPLARVARVTVNLEGTATFTIDGVTALRGTQQNVLGSSAVRYNTGASGMVTTTTVATLVDAFTPATDQKTVIAVLNLPANTVINGTGTWRAVVEEYDA